MEEPSATFDEWLKWAFNHPVAAEVNDEWWLHVPGDWEDGGWLDRPPERALAFVTRLFENPLAYLSSYSDEQIDRVSISLFFEPARTISSGSWTSASILSCEYVAFAHLRTFSASCSHQDAQTMCGSTRIR